MNTADLSEINARLDAGDRRMGAIEASLKENTRLTVTNTEITMEIRELMELGKAGFRLLGWAGVAVKWLGVIAGGAVAVWTAYQAFRHGAGGK